MIWYDTDVTTKQAMLPEQSRSEIGKDLRESRLMPGSVLDPHTLAEAISLSAHRPGKGVHSLTTANTPHWFPLTWQA
jgi:hypothetical protein